MSAGVEGQMYAEPRVHWHLAYVYLATGQLAEARAAAARFAQLWPPDSAEVRQIQADIGRP